MATFISSVLFAIVTSFIGYNLVIICDRDKALNIAETLGLSYLFGIAAISVEIFALGLFGINFNSPIIVLAWLPLILFNIPKYRSVAIDIQPKGAEPFKFSPFEKLIFSLLAFEVLYTFFRSMMKPIESFDSVAIWALKAKVLYLANVIPANFFQTIGRIFLSAHPDYPLLAPFSQVWFYEFIGRFNDYLVKMIFPLDFLAFLLVFYGALKKAVSDRKIALLFTFLLASIKQFNDYATNGYADLQLAIYASITFIFFFMWVKYKKNSYFTMAVISCAFAFWTKNEGGAVLLTALAVIVCMALSRSGSARLRFLDLRGYLYALAFLLVILAAWYLFKASLHLQNDVVNITDINNLNPKVFYQRITPILYEYQIQVFGLKKWNIVWIVFLYMIITRFTKLSLKEYGYIGIPVFMILAFYTSTYFLTPNDIRWQLSMSMSRLFIHILPLSVFFIALNVKDIYGKDRRGG